MLNSINELKDLTEQHTEWRGRCLNLIASENLTSKPVQWYLTSDFGHRYNTFYDDPMKRNYLGNKYIALVETKARETAQKLFRCQFAELRPLAGEMAGNAVILGLTEEGDTVLETGENFGGQEICSRLISASLLKKSLNVEYLAYDPRTSDLDIEKNIHDSEILAEARKVEIHHVPSFEEEFNKGHLQTEVTIYTKKGHTYSGFGQIPLSEGKKGLDEKQLNRKFKKLAALVIDPIGVEKIIDLIDNLEKLQDIRKLMRMLRGI
ncbi:unnamed protein product [marine sediment metagenome]|uniref:Uncharacterized protein n=1 Tax=marine sediment metagenome TaxID=412755 RepID=X1SN18_9ZZZZ